MKKAGTHYHLIMRHVLYCYAITTVLVNLAMPIGLNMFVL